MARSTINSVIFDMDGVLVDSNAAHFAAFQKMGESLGVPFGRLMLERTFGMHNNQIFPLWLGDGLSPEKVRELALQKEAIYREIAQNTLRPIPGAVDLVKRFQDGGFALAVGSSGPRANVELAVKTLQLEAYFSVLITGDDVTHGKPSPEIFLKAALKLGKRAEECLVIEDAPQGVQAAINAGMKVFALTSSKPASELGAAHRIVNSLQEINPTQL